MFSASKSATARPGGLGNAGGAGGALFGRSDGGGFGAWDGVS